MFWNRLTPEESDEFIELIRVVAAWVSHCEATRAYWKKKGIYREADPSLGPTDEMFIRWDQLARKFWNEAR